MGAGGCTALRVVFEMTCCVDVDARFERLLCCLIVNMSKNGTETVIVLGTDYIVFPGISQTYLWTINMKGSNNEFG